MVVIATKTLVGWEEWLSLKEIGLPLIKAKIDTGAKTSALHAFKIKPFIMNGQKYASFYIHPMQNNKKVKVKCIAPIVDRRYVSDSGGHKERRFVIETPMTIGRKTYDIEITLTDRDTMSFRMLLGRQALAAAGLIVDPAKSFCLGMNKKADVLGMYRKNITIGNS